ncbi:MAG: hypothetical protein JNJ45_06730 [Chthonomonas sp.]|nr:hypothetical protein [Chthonomonas sp.]
MTGSAALATKGEKSFSVFEQDGEKVLANLDQLQAWICEGLVTLNTWIEDGATSQQMGAISVKGLRFKLTDHLGLRGLSRKEPRFRERPPLTEQHRGFNWGAFTFTWIWGFNHRKPGLFALLGLSLAFIPYWQVAHAARNRITAALLVFLLIRIILGCCGNRWAWESGRFESMEKMSSCQTIWGRVGFTVTAVIFVWFLWAASQ